MYGFAIYRFLVIALVSGLLLAGGAGAAEFSGEYIANPADGSIHLKLQQVNAQLISGEMFDGVATYPLIGKRDDNTASGRINTETPPGLGFTATFGTSDDQLLVQIYPVEASGNPAWDFAQNVTFLRSAVAPAATSQDNAGSTSNVFINRQALSAEQIADLERQYQTKLVDGRYWYDQNCGAWGLEGGPTAGFIIASLPLPGPMPQDVSGGGTGIFINGRELHPVDRQALINLFGKALPGRYWLDGYGNLGAEGGGVLVNLAVAAQQAGQQTTQSGSGTVSTGSSGAMFSGRSLSTGKPTFWYAGM